MRRNSSPSNTAPLLALVNATAEWHAGMPGLCSASVRLLDRVHFTVYGGDCVVVHHDDPASARVLLAALGGHGSVTAGGRLRGERQCAAGVRIRRCSIPVAAVAELEEGWRQIDAPSSGSSAVQPAVHLLRASRHSRISAHEQQQWRGWAHRVRATGGALVIVAPAVARPAVIDDRPPVRSTTSSAALREPAGADYIAQPTRTPHADRLRALWLHHGRLGNVRSWM